MFSVGTHTECIHTYICISIYIAVYTDWHRQKTSITRRPSEAQMAQSCSSSSAGQGCSTLTKHMHVSMHTQYRSLQWLVLGAHSITRLRPWVSLALGPIYDPQGAPQPWWAVATHGTQPVPGPHPEGLPGPGATQPPWTPGSGWGWVPTAVTALLLCISSSQPSV